MSGRQAKLTRREIRRSAEAGLRTMQEQQEHAIMNAINRCNVLTTMHDLLSATVHNLRKEVEALRPPKGVTTLEILPGPDGDARPLETPDAG